jgi:hypothetical protein
MSRETAITPTSLAKWGGIAVTVGSILVGITSYVASTREQALSLSAIVASNTSRIQKLEDGVEAKQRIEKLEAKYENMHNDIGEIKVTMTQLDTKLGILLDNFHKSRDK